MTSLDATNARDSVAPEVHMSRVTRIIGNPLTWVGLALCIPGALLIFIGQWFQER